MTRAKVPARRIDNITRFWQQRIDACQSLTDYVSVSFDRAKAAVRMSVKAGDHDALKDLGTLLMQWSERQENRHSA